MGSAHVVGAAVWRALCRLCVINTAHRLADDQANQIEPALNDTGLNCSSTRNGNDIFGVWSPASLECSV